MTNHSIGNTQRALLAAGGLLAVAESSDDPALLADACVNLANAFVHAKDLAQALEMASRAERLYGEVVGPMHENTLQMNAMAKKLEQKITADYKDGVDWRRSYICASCGDRFPWSLEVDKMFESGLSFVISDCPNCGVAFNREKHTV